MKSKIIIVIIVTLIIIVCFLVLIYNKVLTVGEVSPNLHVEVGGMVVLRKSDGAVLWLS